MSYTYLFVLKAYSMFANYVAMEIEISKRFFLSLGITPSAEI